MVNVQLSYSSPRARRVEILPKVGERALILGPCDRLVWAWVGVEAARLGGAMFLVFFQILLRDSPDEVSEKNLGEH